MRSKIEEEKIKYDWLKLLSFMSTSARGCVEEQKMHGPYRLVTAIDRIITLLENHGLTDEFLRKEGEKIRENKHVIVDGDEPFIKFLDELVSDFTGKLKEGAAKE